MLMKKATCLPSVVQCRNRTGWEEDKEDACMRDTGWIFHVCWLQANVDVRSDSLLSHAMFAYKTEHHTILRHSVKVHHDGLVRCPRRTVSSSVVASVPHPGGRQVSLVHVVDLLVPFIVEEGVCL
jgi:hypothetical protein